jgi:peptide/nickel transport system substrate-binding protein
VGVIGGAGWELGSGDVREKDGEPLELTVGWLDNFGPNRTALELIQAQLAEVGIGLTLETGTPAEFVEALDNHQYDLAWGNLSRADGDVLRTVYAAATTRYGVEDPELEELFAEEVATPDAEARDGVLADVQERLLDQAYLVPVFELTTILGVGEGIHDVSLGADSRLQQLTDTWVDS